MAGSLNKVTLIGNLGRDPDIRVTQNGTKLATLALATSESWSDKRTGNRVEQTEWHRVTIFVEGLVDVVERYLRKGAKIYVEGALQTRKRTDQQGQDRYSTEIVLRQFESKLIMLDSRGADGEPGDERSCQHQPAGDVDSDDIPF